MSKTKESEKYHNSFTKQYRTKRLTGNGPPGPGPGTTNFTNCSCRKRRRRRTLSDSVVWLLIGLIWLERPIIINCNSNINGNHLINININKNRIINNDQQKRKTDILNQSKKSSKVYTNNKNNAYLNFKSNNDFIAKELISGKKKSDNNNTDVNRSDGTAVDNVIDIRSNKYNNNKRNLTKFINNKNYNYISYDNNNYFDYNEISDDIINFNIENLTRYDEQNNNNFSFNETKLNKNRKFSNNNNHSFRYGNNRRQLFKVIHEKLPYNKKYINNNNNNNNNLHFQYNKYNRYKIYPKYSRQRYTNDKRKLQKNFHHNTNNQKSNSNTHKNYKQKQVYLGAILKSQKLLKTKSAKNIIDNNNNYNKMNRKKSILAGIGCPNCIYNIEMLTTSDLPLLDTLVQSNLLNKTKILPNIETTLFNNKNSQKYKMIEGSSKLSDIQQLTSDSIRLVTIKHQILSKLGLDKKPIVPKTLPKKFIMETLYRSSDSIKIDFGDYNVENNNNNNNNNNDVIDDNNYNENLKSNGLKIQKTNPTASNNNNNNNNKLKSSRYSNSRERYDKDNIEPDDFYGKTREIITFAEKGGILNGQRLIEFNSLAEQLSGQDLSIHGAVIWVRLDLRIPQAKLNTARFPVNENLKVWVFRLVGSHHNTTQLDDKKFSEITMMSTSLNVQINQLGWQKLDITETVRYWYEKDKNNSLRLLIDCSGCKDRVALQLFDDVHTETSDINSKNFDSIENKEHHRHHHKTFELFKQYHQNHYHQPQNISNANTFDNKYDNNNNNINNNTNNNNNNNNNKNKVKLNINDNNYNANSDDHKNTIPNTDRNRPFLVVHTEPITMNRVRRRAIDCSAAINGQCCKESFYVSFKALGWDDWIIAPHGYFANYCRGDCGGRHRTPDTFQSYHTHVMEEFRKMDQLSGMQPCCAPMKYSSMSLIYYGKEGIIKRDLPKMVVDECGCP